MSVAVTPTRKDIPGNVIQKISIAWVSASDGTASGTFYAHGFLVKVVTNPGSAAPTASYDITLVDDAGMDAAEGKLVDRHTTTTESVYPFVSGAPTPVMLHGTHTFTIANAGDTKNGVCDLYVMPRL